MEAAVSGARLRLAGRPSSATREDERLGGSGGRARPSPGDLCGDQAGAGAGESSAP